MSTNELLEAVDALSQPIKRKVIQDVLEGTKLAGTRTVTIEFPSLLNQLDGAIRGSIGIGGSKALAHERNMLDADALYKFVRISSIIRDWARSVQAKVTPGDAGATLRSWYTRYVERERTGESFYLKKLHGWGYEIEAKLDPPRIRELPQACPVCGADRYWNKSDKLSYLHPLIVEYRPTGPDMIQEARALCRACEKVWGVRELQYELEQAESSQESA